MWRYCIIICDDDPKQAVNLSLKVGIAFAMAPVDDHDIEYEVGKLATKYQEVLDYLDENSLDGGIYFLDIELDNDHNGVDLAAEIKKRDERAQIIFVTAYSEYMPMNFERRIGAVDYINKNDADLQARMNETVRDALTRLGKSNFSKRLTFSYRFGRQINNINVEDVLYIHTTQAAHKLLLVAANKRSEFVGDIKAVDEENDFLAKISQSCLINPKNVAAINLRKRTIAMLNGESLSFSRRFRHEMDKLVDEYNWKVEMSAKTAAPLGK
ncbi:DNA-binding response regulator [Lactobacillus delbrueckii subsp. lactis]|nr:DNA-binding response regulator [Lactobacillus delbrueckii subsp. lactis]